MTAEHPMGDAAESVDPAIPLAADESVAWTGRPRWTVILPAVVTGLGLAVAGVVGFWSAETLLALALVPIGIAIPIGRFLVNRNTQYVVTEQALYRKRGVLSRSVSQANLETVQNSSYSQSSTGSFFGYGAVEFEIAGGTDLTFRAIEDPQAVRALVDRVTGGNDGIAGDTASTAEVPGSVEQWQQIRDEVQAVRQTIEQQN